jgi:hypothetical protein
MNPDGDPKKTQIRGWVYLFGILLFFAIVIIGAVAIIPAVSPSAGAEVADLLRSVLGPRPVAAIESVSFRMQDSINGFIAAQNGEKLQISIRQDNVNMPVQQPSGHLASLNIPGDPGKSVVADSPQIGWQAYGPSLHEKPVMAQALVTLDPKRPYAGIALVRIDLSAIQLNMMPGFLEPSHATNVVNAIPNLGLIPEKDRNNLIAAFNGGFKAVNGNYGMMVNGVTLLPPIPGIATIAIYQDGHVNIGAWGQEINPASDLVAYRQNCPLILQNGQLNQQVNIDNRDIWGQTISNQEVTWRTGIGITKNGRYLIYAVGNGTTVELLAQALQKAGAYNAMQLDINRHYAHFVAYQATGKPGNPLMATQLLDQMESDPSIYLVAHSRDYFYLTTR